MRCDVRSHDIRIGWEKWAVMACWDNCSFLLAGYCHYIYGVALRLGPFVLPLYVHRLVPITDFYPTDSKGTTYHA